MLFLKSQGIFEKARTLCAFFVIILIKCLDFSLKSDTIMIDKNIETKETDHEANNEDQGRDFGYGRNAD